MTQSPDTPPQPASTLPNTTTATPTPPFTPSTNTFHSPPNVGIHHLDIYFPSTYITQTELELYNGVSQGKYTIGLGQQCLSFLNDREDIYSITLTALSQFMKKYNISPSSVGRLEVGSETIADHSKSIKSHLMQLFGEHTDIEGIDSMNACYGGTAALLNSVNWIESSAFDGRWGLAVATDIAEYAEGAARPTGGCGVVIMSIGPNAPLVIERSTRSSHLQHVWDFYKPHLNSPYPVVDGKYSNQCYLQALDKCYGRYVEKMEMKRKREIKDSDKVSVIKPFDLDADIDYIVMHAPYNKLVQKSYARLLYNDAHYNAHKSQYQPLLKQFSHIQRENSYDVLELEKAWMSVSKAGYERCVAATTLLPRQCGNMYAASLYAGLVSLVATKGEQLANKRLLLFSYGSGLAASMFAIHVNEDVAQLEQLKQQLNIEERLKQRIKVDCHHFVECMKKRETLHHQQSGFKATDSIEQLAEGTFYLIEKDDKGKRIYARKGEEQTAVKAN